MQSSYGTVVWLRILSPSLDRLNPGCMLPAVATGPEITTGNSFGLIATHVVFTTADVGSAGESPGDELVFDAAWTSPIGRRCTTG